MKAAWGFFFGAIFTMVLTFTVLANAAEEILYTIPEPSEVVVYPRQPKELIIRFQ